MPFEPIGMAATETKIIDVLGTAVNTTLRPVVFLCVVLEAQRAIFVLFVCAVFDFAYN